MPKSVARRKTKKAVAKRFKVTGTGKVVRASMFQCNGTRNISVGISSINRETIGVGF